MTLGALATLLLEQGRISEAIQQCETALAIHRELGMRRLQAEVLRVLAALTRQGHGDLDSAERLILEAESIDTEVANAHGRIVCLCERGHQELMRGRSGEALLRQAQALASGLELQPDSILGATIQHLGDTQQAYTAGRALFRGEALQDLPDGLRRWLAETGQLPAA